MTLLADLEDFDHDHRPRGGMTDDATAPTWNSYLLTDRDRSAAREALDAPESGEWTSSLVLPPAILAPARRLNRGVEMTRMTSLSRRSFLRGAVGGVTSLAGWQHGWRLGSAAAEKGAPSGQMTWAVHVTIAPTWFDPAETPGIITPYMFMYAIHDDSHERRTMQMARINAVDSGTAVGKAKELLDQVQKKLGFVPNLMRTMAVSPAVLEGYLGLSGALAGGALPPKVREQIALTVGEANGCQYYSLAALDTNL